MRTHIGAFALALAIGATPALSAQSSLVEKQILAARDTVWRAWYTNDTALLRRFIPPAAAAIEGTTPMQWSDRKKIVDGAHGFAGSKQRLVDVRFANTEIERAGETALVRSSFRVITEAGGRQDTTRGRATELFVRQGDTWLNPYWRLEHGVAGYGREIPLPDTLGASFSIADSAAKMGQATDYDFLVGTWTFRFQSRQPDGTFLAPFAGHWTFDKKPGGGLVEDRWRPDNPSIPMGVSLYTYRTFDPDGKVWFMLGTHANGGAVQPGLTWSDATSRYAIQRGDGVLSRIRYFAITENSFLWRSDRSVDGGKTWLLDAGTMEAKRVGK